ncbi:MAG: hypothetical protein LBT19_01210 [Candidatus Nomurabacteria bacterium]|jgi:hypothetical protein|nr:hypothetical protein [Candidatus Nomurabacteria bacterium]
MRNSKFLEKFAKYSGMIALCIYVVTCVFIVATNYQDPSYTISRHIGISGTSIVVFAVADTIATALLVFNLLYYSRKRWDLGKVFVVYAVMTAACLVLVGWFPHVDGGSQVVTMIHRISAWVVIFLTPFFMMVFLRKTKGRTGKIFRAILILFVAEAVVFALVLVLAPDFFVSTSLYSESLYLVSLVVLTQVLAFAPNDRMMR